MNEFVDRKIRRFQLVDKWICRLELVDKLFVDISYILVKWSKQYKVTSLGTKWDIDKPN